MEFEKEKLAFLDYLFTLVSFGNKNFLYSFITLFLVMWFHCTNIDIYKKGRHQCSKIQDLDDCN